MWTFWICGFSGIPIHTNVHVLPEHNFEVQVQWWTCLIFQDKKQITIQQNLHEFTWAEFTWMHKRIKNPTLWFEKWNLVLIVYLLLPSWCISFSCACTILKYKVNPEHKVRWNWGVQKLIHKDKKILEIINTTT